MDLSTRYLGLTLRNPVVVSACPISRSLDGIRRAEDAGAGALVMYSLFEEELDLESRQLDHYLGYLTESFAEALTWQPRQADYRMGPDEYLDGIRRAKEAVQMPIVASLNGISTGGWTAHAKMMQEAGADAIELNVYFVAADPMMDGLQAEQSVVDVLAAVKQHVSIPVAVKIGPYFSSMANMAQRLTDAGADGLVLFNRFYQPDLDLESLTVVPTLVLSTSEEMRLPLRWVAMLCDRIRADFAISTGVHTHADVLKGMMAGAKVTMMASELLQNGIQRIATVLGDVNRWMTAHEYESITQMQGSMSQQRVDQPGAFERANYMQVLASWRPDPAGQLYREMVGQTPGHSDAGEVARR
ncbi:MAG: dihydroorotate dehydrogenase-like protein [Anaerolineae bacterium]